MASVGTYASLQLAPDRQPCQHPTTQFFTGRMPFLPPNQRRQSTEALILRKYYWCFHQHPNLVVLRCYWLGDRKGIQTAKHLLQWSQKVLFSGPIKEQEELSTCKHMTAISQRVPAVCSTHTDNLRWQEFCCQWTSRVEQFTCGTAFKWRHRGDFQKTSEDISV